MISTFSESLSDKRHTPSMQALHSHVPQFLELYSNIECCSQQGMEKYNVRASKNYFRSTNHKGTSALEQLLVKKHRVQFIEAAGCERVKRAYKCSNFSGTGHSLKTCSAECNNCSFYTFFAF